MFHSQTAFLVVGLLFVVLPIITWTILYNRHERVSVSAWCTGGLLYGIGFMLVGLRDSAPAWLALAVGNVLIFFAYPFRAVALKRELGERLRRYVVLPWALASLSYLAAFKADDAEASRLVVALVANIAGSAWLGWLAWRLHRRTGFRSAALLAYTDGLFALALIVRMGFVFANWDGARAMAGSIDFLIALISSALAMLYGSLGYIGIALETTSSLELRRSTELAREQERRAQTDLRIREQAASQDERELLLAQREEMLAVMAHEVRQPLNNASAALQSAAESIGDVPGDAQDTQVRLRRASAVLTQITAALDNTLADAVLLNDGKKSLARQDADVDTFVNLVLAEFEPSQRDRIVRERATDTRTASMNTGLMRLALRNLVANALAYSPADRPVVIHISDSDDPLALVIDVSDEGTGIPAELLPRLFSRGARAMDGQHRHGHGLGLYVVRRVMALHGGEVRVSQNSARGVTMRLVIPQALAE